MKKINYVTFSSIPSPLPSSLQIIKTCESLSKYNHKVTLIKPGTGYKKISINKYYGLKNKVHIKHSLRKDKKKYIDCGYKFINKEIFNHARKKYKKIEDFIYGDYLKNNKISYFLVKKKPLRIDTALDIKRTKNELFKI
mgnify:CR=1 FL=1